MVGFLTRRGPGRKGTREGPQALGGPAPLLGLQRKQSTKNVTVTGMEPERHGGCQKASINFQRRNQLVRERGPMDLLEICIFNDLRAHGRGCIE